MRESDVLKCINEARRCTTRDSEHHCEFTRAQRSKCREELQRYHVSLGWSQACCSNQKAERPSRQNGLQEELCDLSMCVTVRQSTRTHEANLPHYDLA